ncbi:MAG: phosphatidylglycerophosphatase A [Planctomycetes bacterium]|nr:phosphatidylglycerophosphatase A [Planctomycetota bacterium]
MSWRWCVVTFFGAGASPVAPGTAGSLAATGIAWVVVASDIRGAAGWLLGLAFVASSLNVALGAWIEDHFGGKDPGAVVIDECAGQWIALLPLAWAGDSAWPWYLAGFLLFRAFDIVKPLGARRLEKLPRGWGVLLDDVLSGIYVAGIIAVAHAQWS